MPTLTDATIRAAKPGTKPYKLSDGEGLHLLVTPGGARLWRLAYRWQGKQKLLSLGAYNTAGSRTVQVPLAAARERRAEARRMLANGIDPSATRKAEKLAAESAARTFRSVGDEWFARKVVAEGKADRTRTKTAWLLRVLCDRIGSRPIGEIEAPELLTVLRRFEAAEQYESARRARSVASRVFRFGIAAGYCARDPAADLVGALTAPSVTHRPAIIEPAAVGQLMRAIHGYHGNPVTRLGLLFLSYTFARPGEVRFSEWTEIDATTAVWEIPASKAKMRRPHRVPLSRQALAVLDELRRLTGGGQYLFPSPTTPKRPISENTLLAALLRLGYERHEISAHGMRSTASTLLNESRLFASDAVERQLAHVHKDPVRGVYDRSAHWLERVRMMQWWGDELDRLRDLGRILPLARTAG
ncbi:tyrosine-type recombinase/integrase [Rhodoplanes azumiensis]|uniref:Tyrosine-type recombinase/integrase n=1 Tax=Rhodoplanes azumiensis TaxID=1897628 RepID=A0ABW5ASP9_9BRAD